MKKTIITGTLLSLLFISITLANAYIRIKRNNEELMFKRQSTKIMCEYYRTHPIK